MERGPMSQDQKEQIAQDRYGKGYEELGTNEKKAVGGVKGGQIGGEARKEQMANEHGGDVHAAYAEMGSKGGETRKDQMAEEHGGDVSAGYSEMGHQGGEKGGNARKEQMAAEHGGDASAGYSEMGQKGGQA
ncbi:hypothetical protein OEZ86_006586 [Tetradesmus obliquus]|uniref:Uncharacterized protein n=2 Tax=Tetradesmus obliquus TaxID=3088 RepID=A0ABY8TVZ5_TETOB|nr:hypothetical protein OEZ85_006897 [Tetradesmus obliquus]WIA33456.1 hypothetical protein OEZ86_006586 [Tetradesmus obliquus]|eukprot:jgi/Sobl393_1/5606/SZX63060.1